VLAPLQFELTRYGQLSAAVSGVGR
jgi:hypothetical protein